MDSIGQEYNIYCDESRVENSDSAKMVIGAIIIPRNKKKELVRQIGNIFNKHVFQGELKWTKTSERFIGFYRDILNYFLEVSLILAGTI